MTLGQRIKYLIAINKLTQEKVGEKLGVPRGTVGNWVIDRCEPDAQTLARLAAIFNVTLE